VTDRVRRPAGDDGLIAILVIGLMSLVLAMMIVVINISAVIIARRNLVSVADGAAVAAAQRIDLAAFYAGDGEGAIPLDPEAVDEVREEFGKEGDIFSITLSPDATTVTVRVRRSADLPFGAFGFSDVEVDARATARTPLR
jgi:hypothetical protein